MNWQLPIIEFEIFFIHKIPMVEETDTTYLMPEILNNFTPQTIKHAWVRKWHTHTHAHTHTHTHTHTHARTKEVKKEQFATQARLNFAPTHHDLSWLSFKLPHKNFNSVIF